MKIKSRLLPTLIVAAAAVATGLGLAQWTARPATETAADAPPAVAGANTSANVAPSPASNQVAEQPAPVAANEPAPVEEPAPPVIPSFQEVKAEVAADPAVVAVLKDFYEAYNMGQAESLIRSFDMAVPVTVAVDAALAAGQPRPVAATITGVEVRSDSSVVVQVKEERSNSTTVERSFELIPTQASYLLVAYRSSGEAGEASGFAN